jgi:hypothetical protein
VRECGKAATLNKDKGNCSGASLLRAFSEEAESRCGTSEVEKSIMDTSYGGEEFQERAFRLERPPVELYLVGHLNMNRLKKR